jgi:predicted enzyme related to lactoylglutathione lyase
MPEAIGRLHWIVIDTVDPAGIAPFWCALLGVQERGWFGDDYLMLTADGERAAGRVPARPRGQVRQEPAPRRPRGGRSRPGRSRRSRPSAARPISDILEMPGGYRWRVMADPEGNEFCIVPRDED